MIKSIWGTWNHWVSYDFNFFHNLVINIRFSYAKCKKMYFSLRKGLNDLWPQIRIQNGNHFFLKHHLMLITVIISLLFMDNTQIFFPHDETVTQPMRICEEVWWLSAVYRWPIDHWWVAAPHQPVDRRKNNKKKKKIPRTSDG